MSQADVDQGVKEEISGDERRELVELRHRTRVLEMEDQILKRASAYFARENVPKIGSRLSRNSPPTGSTSRWPARGSESRGRAIRVARPRPEPKRRQAGSLFRLGRDSVQIDRAINHPAITAVLS